jgi:hypothetical protein
VPAQNHNCNAMTLTLHAPAASIIGKGGGSR